MIPGLAGIVGFSGEASAPPPVTLGNILVPTTNVSASANFQQGTAFQASVNFTATRFFITGPFTGTSSFTFRCCIYACTSATVWSGALLGQTAPASNFANLEQKELALLASVSIVSGNWYALCIQPDSPGGTIGCTAGNGRAFSDTYSDGAAATAGASFANAASLSCIYISS